jgi:predicted metal-dependent phosphoesterase TrpH
MDGFMRAHGPIDLHLHSNVSDGTGTPAQVARDAFAAGVRTMALTDHDTVDGWQEAAQECQRLGMTFIPGMEFSTHVSGGSVHILAYLFDPSDEGLRGEMARLVRQRAGRLEEMTKLLSEDFDISWDDVLAQSQDGTTLGRPHLADALIQNAIVESRQEAFATMLHSRERYYVPTPATDPVTAVTLIRAAGGVPIIAHPATNRHGEVVPRDYFLELHAAGLAGFELGHRENVPEGVSTLQSFVDEFDLIVTGSSDYHGTGKPNQPGENNTLPEMLVRIIEQGVGAEPVYPA